MSDLFPNIKTVVVRIVTDKPVRKTPYQVKGVIMRKYPSERVIPMLDGSYRDKFLYPRVQVKILNEDIYIIGVKEGVDPVLSLVDNLTELDFGNITFSIKDFDIKNDEQQFIFSEQILRYSFVTPWVALNKVTSGKYKSLSNKKKIIYLNQLLGQNLIFLANEVGASIENGIYAKVTIHNLVPKHVDDNKWKAFQGEFKSNIILPNYIGLGNGITRGFGSIYKEINAGKKIDKEKLSDQDKDLFFTIEDLKSKNKHFKSRFKTNKNHKNKKWKKQKRSKNIHNSQNKRSYSKHNNHSNKTKEIFSNNTDGNFIQEDKFSDNIDDQRFNTEKHHKKQHKF